MDRTNFLPPSSLSVLTKAVAAHCSKHGIDEAIYRENIAARTIKIFQSGTKNFAEIQARLESSDYRFS